MSSLVVSMDAMLRPSVRTTGTESAVIDNMEIEAIEEEEDDDDAADAMEVVQVRRRRRSRSNGWAALAGQRDARTHASWWHPLRQLAHR